MEKAPLPSHVQWLLERRSQSLAEALAREAVHIDAEAALRVLMVCDPSAGKVATQWLCDSYLSRGFLWEDAAAGSASKAAETLRMFSEHRAKLPGADRNLSAHAGLASLYKAVKPLLASTTIGDGASGKALRRSERESALSGSFVAHRSGDLIVAVPLTENASRWWGKGTRWCTAADRGCVFHNYNRTGPLVVIVLAGRHRGEAVRKWQLHVGQGDAQLMDEDDAEVDADLVEEEWDRVGGVLEWAVSRNGAALWFVPEARRTTRLCIEAVRQRGSALAHVPALLRTPEVCLEAVRRDGAALWHVPVEARTPETCLEAVREIGQALKYVPIASRMPELCIEAVRQCGSALEYVPDMLRTRELCLEAVRSSGGALPYVPWELLTPELCGEAVRQCGSALNNVPKEIRTPEICLEAVRTYGGALRRVPPKYRTQEICAEAVLGAGMALEYVPDGLVTAEICMAAVRQNPWAIQYVPMRFLAPEICLEAVRRNGRVLQDVPVADHSPTLCLEAVRNDGAAVNYVIPKFRTLALCLEAVRQGGALELIPEQHRAEILASGANIRACPKPPSWDARILGDLGRAISAHAAAGPDPADGGHLPGLDGGRAAPPPARVRRLLGDGP